MKKKELLVLSKQLLKENKALNKDLKKINAILENLNLTLSAISEDRIRKIIRKIKEITKKGINEK